MEYLANIPDSLLPEVQRKAQSHQLEKGYENKESKVPKSTFLCIYCSLNRKQIRKVSKIG